MEGYRPQTPEERPENSILAILQASGEKAEKIQCQYCEDVGPCQYCKRGQVEIADLKKNPPKPLFKPLQRKRRKSL